MHGRYNVCYMGENCSQYFVVEYDGSVYPCDFFVRKDLLLGNIKNDSWEDILKSKEYQEFSSQKTNWNKECELCPYLNLCHGDCQKFRYGAPINSKEMSALCKGWKMFYTRKLPSFIGIAEEYKAQHNIKTPPHFKMDKIGRNLPCPCGSGKKFKNCCGKINTR